MTSNLVRSDFSFRKRSAICLVCRSLLLCIVAFALSFAFAFVLCPQSFVLCPWPYTFVFAFASDVLGNAVDLHRVWLFRVTSDVIHNPTLIRVQVRLNDCSQLVVVTFELVGIHQQVVSEF